MTQTLTGLMRERVAQHGERSAVVLDEVTWTFAELDVLSERVAAGLHSRGIGAGDRVAVLSRNVPEYYALLFACARTGAVLVGINWRLSAREVATVLDDAAPSLLVVEPELAAKAVGSPATDTVDLEPGLPGLVDASDPSAPVVDDEPDRVVVQLYTSGTTGAPKGIQLTHANLAPSPVSGVRLYGMSANSVNLLVSPMFHIGGLGYSLTCLSLGGCTVLVREASPAHLLTQVAERRVTHTFLVPTVIASMIDSPQAASADLSTLAVIAYGGAPMSPALLRRARVLLGCGFRAVYGMTETAGTVIALLADDYDRPDVDRLLQSIGRPLPWVAQAMVADLVTGAPCAPGEVGEIWVRSPQVMPGYWNRPESTRSTLRDDGWLRTGDAAYVDEEGYYFMHDRLKDMIISGGENVFPAEVEAVLAELDEVAECAVVGVPCDRWGETPVALVVPRPGSTINPRAVIEHCRENLAHYKCPSSVETLSELPHNASGKILKGELRARLAREESNA